MNAFWWDAKEGAFSVCVCVCVCLCVCVCVCVCVSTKVVFVSSYRQMDKNNEKGKTSCLYTLNFMNVTCNFYKIHMQ